ncbi:13331_t:CDS:2, partial [Acaulospora morrowiae]
MLLPETLMGKVCLRYVEDSLQTRVPSREVEFADILGLSRREKILKAQRNLKNPSIKDVHTTSLPTDDSDELKENIAKENNIHLPIFPETYNIDIQSAWRFARKADPSGLRTVEIITKVDQILDYTYHEDRHKELASLVSGRDERTIKNEMFIIRNSSNEESRRARAVNPGDLEDATIIVYCRIKCEEMFLEIGFGLSNLIIKLSELQKVPQEHRIRLFLEQRKAELEEKLQSLLPPLAAILLDDSWNSSVNSTMNSQVEREKPRLYRGQQWNFRQFNLALLILDRFIIFSSYSAETFDPIKLEIAAEEWCSCFHQDNHQYTWTLEELCEFVQTAHGGQLTGGLFTFPSFFTNGISLLQTCLKRTAQEI